MVGSWVFVVLAVVVFIQVLYRAIHGAVLAYQNFNHSDCFFVCCRCLQPVVPRLFFGRLGQKTLVWCGHRQLNQSYHKSRARSEHGLVM